MSDPYRTVVRALAEVTTQLKRVADSLATAAEEGRDGVALVPPTPDDDGASVEVDRLRHSNQQLLGDRVACIKAEQQRDLLAGVLRDVLNHFIHETHPGHRCLQTGHVPVATVEQWRAALMGVVEQHPAERRD